MAELLSLGRFTRMDIPGITWRGESIEDVELLHELPPSLVRILSDTNGFVLFEGALHVRGACLTPEWHSLRVAWRGASAFHTLYDSIEATDVPFAQDQVGDQFLLRAGRVIRLSGETGEVEALADSLEDFFSRVSQDIEGFLNVGLRHTMQPGQLLLAYPPFVFRESGAGGRLATDRRRAWSVRTLWRYRDCDVVRHSGRSILREES